MMTDMENQIAILNRWLEITEFHHDNLIDARNLCDTATTQFDRENKERDVGHKETLLLAEMNNPEIRGSAVAFSDTTHYPALRASVESRLKIIKEKVDSKREEPTNVKPKRLTNRQLKLRLVLFLQESEAFEAGKPEVIRNNNIISSLAHCRRRIYEQDTNFTKESDIDNIVGIIDRVISENVSWRPDSWSRLQEVFSENHPISKKFKEKSDDDSI